MIRLRSLLTLLVLTLILYSCRPTKPAVSPSSYVEAGATSYIGKYKDLAVSEMKRTGIPASITLAQGMIESDFGRSRLAREANNHFGIKCHDDWNGASIRHNDDRRNECFRKYNSPEESFRDHSDFLKSTSRYKALFTIPATDYRSWAKGLKRAGYATNPQYADMLIRKIEENNLDRYDRSYSEPEMPVATAKTVKTQISDSTRPIPEKVPEELMSASGPSAVPARVPRIMENNRIQYIIVKEGETMESIEKDFSLLKWELTRYNELSGDFTPVPGQLLYIQPKRDKAEPGREVHIVNEGETLYEISQVYGVRLRKLYEYNRMTEGEEPDTGRKLWLRTFSPVN